ncbi:unnamed protein product [Rodentolepis nana]|uniref:DUF504 domain-containing protein n=1 Tax=Rodentolepis nana TaxID=102285 RepID=A0A0R3TK07_RODNA|nr:unnamed protein product [Rodentolepis nana]
MLEYGTLISRTRWKGTKDVKAIIFSDPHFFIVHKRDFSRVGPELMSCKGLIKISEIPGG